MEESGTPTNNTEKKALFGETECMI